MIKKQEAIDAVNQYMINVEGCLHWGTLEYALQQIKYRINDIPEPNDIIHDEELTKLKVENMFLKKATDNYRESYSEDKEKIDNALIDAYKVMAFLIKHKESAFDADANMAQGWIDKYITITDDPKNYKS